MVQKEGRERERGEEREKGGESERERERKRERDNGWTVTISYYYDALLLTGRLKNRR